MGPTIRFATDEIRRLIVGMGTAVGMPGAAAALWARRVLWYDLVGRPGDGVLRLPEALARLVDGQLDGAAEPWLGPLPDGSGVGLHADRTLPALVLARAAEVAGQMAQHQPAAGLGVVRVWGLTDPGPLAAEVADLAIGPFEATIIGPANSWVAAWPTEHGLPLLFDSSLGDPATEAEGRRTTELPQVLWAPRTSDDEIVLVAKAVQLGANLRAAHERIAPFLVVAARPGALGYLHPDKWERNRATALSDGVPLAAPVAEELADWSRRLGVEPLRPIGQSGVNHPW